MAAAADMAVVMEDMAVMEVVTVAEAAMEVVIGCQTSERV